MTKHKKNSTEIMTNNLNQNNYRTFHYNPPYWAYSGAIISLGLMRARRRPSRPRDTWRDGVWSIQLVCLMRKTVSAEEVPKRCLLRPTPGTPARRWPNRRWIQFMDQRLVGYLRCVLMEALPFIGSSIYNIFVYTFRTINFILQFCYNTAGYCAY